MILFKKHIDWLHIAIFFVFLFTPIESVSVFSGNSSFSVVKLSFLFLLLIWLFYSRKLDNNIFIKYYLVYFVYFIIGLIWSINLDISLRQLVMFLLPTILMCSIISKNLQKREDFQLISIGYLIGCGIMSFFAFTMRDQIVSNARWGEMERVTALGQDANELAFLISQGVGILLLFLGEKRTRIATILSWMVVAFWSFIIIITGSRTGVIILASLFLVFFMNNKRKLPYLLPLLIFALIYGLQFVSGGVIERLMDTSSTIQSNDLSGRGYIWHIGWMSFQEENVALGVGYDNFSYMLVKHGYQSIAAHNTYLSNLICAGFLGFFIFLFFLVHIIGLVFKMHRIENKWNMLYFVFPLFLAMITLEISTRRWLFLLGVVMYKYYLLLRKESRQQITINDNNLK